MSLHTRRLCTILAALAGSTGAWGAAHAQVVVTSLAATGDKALPSGSAKLSRFSVPVINDQGQVAFTARLAGGGTNFRNDQALYVRTPGARALIAARTGAAVVGERSARYRELGDVLLGDNGLVAFTADMVGGKAQGTTGVFRGTAGNVRIVTRTGLAALPAPSGKINDLFSVAMSPDGSLAMQVSLTGPGVTPETSRALIARPSSGAAMMLQANTPVPSLGGAVLAVIGTPVINPAGTIAFPGFVGGLPGDSEQDAAVFMINAGAVERGAAEGLTLSNAPGARAMTFSTTSINAAGTLAFQSLLTGAGATPGDDLAIISGGRSAARMGSVMQGLKLGIVGAPILDGEGRVTFMSSLLGAGVNTNNDLALWSVEADGTARLLAREGAPAGDSVSNCTIVELQDSASTATGHVLYSATVTDAQGQAGQALMAWDPHRGNVLVARSGDALLAGKFTKTVVSLDFASGSGGQDGRRMALGAGGLATFRATFTDGSQAIYVATLPGALSDVADTTDRPLADGRVTSNDLQVFLAAYAAGEALADVAGAAVPGGDGVVDGADLAAFMTDYEQQPR